MNNINRVVITGNLTADPELRSTPSGTSVCNLRIACNTRRKDGEEWVDKPNFFNVTVWGAQGENVARYLSKGRPVAIDGRLEWREWEAQDGSKRQAVDIIADSVQFLNNGNGNGSSDASRAGGGRRGCRGGHPVLGPGGPRSDRGAGHKPNGQGHDHEPTPSHRPHSRKPQSPRRTAARPVADDSCPADRGDAPRRADA